MANRFEVAAELAELAPGAITLVDGDDLEAYRAAVVDSGRQRSFATHVRCGAAATRPRRNRGSVPRHAARSHGMSTSRETPSSLERIRQRLLESPVANTPAGMRLRAAVHALRTPADETATGAPPDLPPEFITLHDRCAPFTMTSLERMYALYEAVRYVDAAGIEGDIVECGVWRGGSSMMAALAQRAQIGLDPADVAVRHV